MKKGFLNFILYIFVFVYILFEELVWERFATPIISYISDLKILKRLELFLQKVDSKIILFIFVVIFGFVELLGIYAGAKFISGEFIKAVFIYLLKIPIAAFVFWMFKATKHKLLEFEWFKKSYYFIVGFMDMIANSYIYKNIKIKSKLIKSYLKEHFLKDKDSLKKRIKAIYKSIKKVFNR